MKWILGLCLVWALGCTKEDKSFSNVECVNMSAAQDTVLIGKQKYWLEVRRGQNNDLHVFLESDTTVNISLLESDFIQMSNQYGCYQTGNTKKYYGIQEEYYIFSDIPPTYLQPNTQIKVRMRRQNDQRIDFIANSI